MPISAIPSSSSSAPAQAASTPTIDFGNGLDSDSFLQLLVTQLKYQSPTEPMDPSELMNATAQLTLVDKMNELVKLQQSDSALTRANIASSIIGKNVSFNDETTGATVTGPVTAVKIQGDALLLRVNGKDIPFEIVTELS
jgi:flagellar basal-body rod modification protein FlgD